MITSRVSSKAQTTIPKAVRAALRLQEGDELLYRIEKGKVTLTRAPAGQKREDPFGTFNEWDSEADRKAYGNL